MTENQQVDIKVNILDGDPVTISISESSTIFQLMNMIKQKTGIQENKQRLLYLGRSLDKEKTLMDYRIHSGVCIQLVQRPVESNHNNPSINENEEVQVIRNSYVVYLPFRITETTTIPTRQNRNPEEASEPSIESNPSIENPIQGAPPVPQYPPISFSSISTQRPLVQAIERLKEDILRIEEFDRMNLSSPVFHSFLHSIETIALSLTEYYHSSQNSEGNLDIQDASLFYHALQTVLTSFQVLLDRLEV